MGLIGLIRAFYGGLLGILSGLTKSTDQVTWGLPEIGAKINPNILWSFL